MSEVIPLKVIHIIYISDGLLLAHPLTQYFLLRLIQITNSIFLCLTLALCQAKTLATRLPTLLSA